MAQDGVTPGGGATEGQARFGLLGRTLGHSWSPLIHARLGSTPYDLIELEPDEVAPFVREDASWRGLNVTIPYKRDAARLADERSGRVERLGVANTLVRRPDGSIYADKARTSSCWATAARARPCRRRSRTPARTCPSYRATGTTATRAFPGGTPTRFSS